MRRRGCRRRDADVYDDYLAMLKTAAETPVEVDGKAPGSADAPVTIAAEAMSDVAAPERRGFKSMRPVKPKKQKQVDKEYERRLAERERRRKHNLKREAREKRERANAPKSNRRRNAGNDEFDFLPVFALSAERGWRRRAWVERVVGYERGRRGSTSTG